MPQLRRSPLSSITVWLPLLAVVGCGGGNTSTPISEGGSTSTTGDTSARGGATSSSKVGAGGTAISPSTTTSGGSSTAEVLAGGTTTRATSTGVTLTPESNSDYKLPVEPKPWQPSEACVAEAGKRLKAMSLEEKAGQLLQGDSAGTSAADVSTYFLGSILSGGGSDPARGDGPSDWIGLVSPYNSAGVAMGLPILYGIDAVHGNNNVSSAVIFPHNIGLGCTRNPKLVEEIGRITAVETRATGINWAFAPVVAAGRDERWGRTYETFAETPELAAELGEASIRGLQGENLSSPSSVLACAKHFAGDGTTKGGDDQGDSTLSESEFQAIAINQYQPAVNAGVGSIMVSFSSYNGLKMSANKQLLTDTLKGTMGFRGFLVSDWAAVQQLGSEPTSSTNRHPVPTREALATAINAGLDMIMEPYQAPTIARYIAEATTRTGTENIPESRIDDAVQRILQIKCEMGLLAQGFDASVDPAQTSQIGSFEHRAVARKAVRESLVLLKNEGSVLPLPKTAKVLIAGTAADSKAKQCGGWTIDWMGLGTKGAGSVNPEPGDTTAITILQGVRDVVGEANVTYASNGQTTESGFTHAVVVVGEKPYAEGEGDATNLALSSVSSADVAAINQVAKLGVPTAVVIVSGRPLIITDLLPQAGAWLAAWLPGSEGNGVADVLFGDFAPTGRLSHSWPRSMTQIPINVGDADYATDAPLYPYGFGLTYPTTGSM